MEGKDTEKPIIFSEWSYPRNDALLKRKDYTLDELVNNKDRNKNTEDEEGRFLKEYITHYKRINEEE